MVKIDKETASGARTILNTLFKNVWLRPMFYLAFLVASAILMNRYGVLEVFKRDEKSLENIHESVRQISQSMLKNDAAIADLSQQIQGLSQQMQDIEKGVIISIIFNPNVPVDKRADAFDRAKELKMNHDIKKQYREFVLKYPDAMWQIKEHPKPSLMPHIPTGAEGDE
jgi:septal ring factor EnvC (AmiA/AmiB activator)